MTVNIAQDFGPSLKSSWSAMNWTYHLSADAYNQKLAQSYFDDQTKTLLIGPMYDKRCYHELKCPDINQPVTVLVLLGKTGLNKSVNKKLSKIDMEVDVKSKSIRE